VILLEWSLATLKPLYSKNLEQEKRDNKYYSFKRNDLHKISRPISYLLAPTLIPRVILGWGAMASCSLVIYCISLTHKKGEPYSGWKLAVINFSCNVSARIVLLTMSIFYITEQ